ncbi:hypothetical protein [Tsukamurella sp. NPDC003166]|uniref:hypothetical protein n=1 Tax=Tsukamurella sp. NPDC003166 TaxID=3154444 RepID=UPI0033B8EF8A
MSTFLTVALLAVLTTVGLVGAVVSDGAASLVWAVTTVAVAGLLAWRLRSAPPGMGLVAAFATGILVVSAGLPLAIVLTETAPDRSPGSSSVLGASDRASTVDPSAELRGALKKADEVLPGGSDSVLNIRIDESSTQVGLLDLAKGQRVWFQYSRSSGKWYEPSRSATNDRQDAVFRAADLAALDLTATAAKATAAADRIAIDRSNRHADDGIQIERRYQDRKLIVEFHMSGEEIHADQTGNLPDNLALAKLDGLLPVAERALRDSGVDPAQSFLSGLEYRVFAPNATAVSGEEGRLRLSVQGGGRSGSIEVTVGRFPIVSLRPSSGTASNPFALSALTAAGLERARADLAQRSAVPTVDANAVSLQVERDFTSSSLRSRGAPPILNLGLGPKAEAYYTLGGDFLRSTRT